MNDIVPAEMPLLEKAVKLNRLSEVSQVALGVCLVKIKDTHEYQSAGYETFESYVQGELGRSKGDISKLTRVGRMMIDGGFSEETVPEVGYSKIYQSILAFPNENADYIIATAQTNTLAEIGDTARENKHGDHEHEWIPARYCTVCGKYERV